MDKVEIETGEDRRAEEEVLCVGKWIGKMVRRWGEKGKQIIVRRGGGRQAYDTEGIAVHV